MILFNIVLHFCISLHCLNYWKQMFVSSEPAQEVSMPIYVYLLIPSRRTRELREYSSHQTSPQPPDPSMPCPKYLTHLSPPSIQAQTVLMPLRQRKERRTFIFHEWRRRSMTTNSLRLPNFPLLSHWLSIVNLSFGGHLSRVRPVVPRVPLLSRRTRKCVMS